MKYKEPEKQLKAALKEINFDALTINDIFPLVIKLKECRPEVIEEIMRNFPEFAGVLKSSYAEYGDMFKTILQNDTETVKEYFDIAEKEMENASESRKLVFELAEKIRADFSKVLDDSGLSVKEKIEILTKEQELINMVSEKDEEIAFREKEITEAASKKDSEKRMFHLKAFGGGATALIVLAAAIAGAVDVEKLTALLGKNNK
ncbi:MAG: hypothetical protein U0N74_02620 [Peptococcaceae bacterium]|jgi:flagellar biosynthesis component FlhA